ncbi:CDP-alcohol phosphatidyltransferase family protein [Streptomyces sp. F63]|uniref:CDP-alcohol phosphatidyltransferase family protein n=1 Tax=Streptomyces sp. F63 TaxID=2824887 RepID=UPI001B394F59|nr:CDP-alcohol phosphatidyltransferase family protein [Streptomyces sp. F63]MBQ0984950.1 CDP-alcohol phosphatidyltransferase family protein [Streptomyces sp. F63]
MALSDLCETRLLRQETTAGAGAQILLLVLLDTAVGLGLAGWLAGLAVTAGTWVLLTRALHRSWPPRPFGPANAVTLARTTLVGGVTALVADAFTGPVPVAALVVLTAVALSLDAVDGQVARRTGTASPLGARFDMEVDAFLILVLSLYDAMALGGWVLLIGAMRYGFVAAARAMPWLNGPLPPSMARKTVAALQGVLLLAAASGLLPYAAAYGTVLGALALLVWSFGRDIGTLWRFRVREGDAPVGENGGGAAARGRARSGARPVAVRGAAAESV